MSKKSVNIKSIFSILETLRDISYSYLPVSIKDIYDELENFLSLVDLSNIRPKSTPDLKSEDDAWNSFKNTIEVCDFILTDQEVTCEDTVLLIISFLYGFYLGCEDFIYHYGVKKDFNFFIEKLKIIDFLQQNHMYDDLYENIKRYLDDEVSMTSKFKRTENFDKIFQVKIKQCYGILNEHRILTPGHKRKLIEIFFEMKYHAAKATSFQIDWNM